ncbi:hypothetical protein AB0I66_40280 [Streptomyces sp. NPDC050439]|uniref:hypothetical protein n=1 Tax=unclassified Streptomyces TaxID=2593676 RepID=UPI003430CD7E
MRGVALDRAHTADQWPEDSGVGGPWWQEPHTPGAPLTWSSIGLDAMALMLVVSLRKQGSRSFAARCQWPRLHPLNERAVPVPHHPLIVVESTRQLALALERRHLPPTCLPPLDPVSVSLGLDFRVRPTEYASATDVAVRLILSDRAPQSGPLARYRLTAEYLHGGTPFASCTMQFARPAPAGPHRDDEPALPACLSPAAAAVGAAADLDVMLARAPQGKVVIVPRDPRHPVLLPGRPTRLPVLAVLEAGRQATLLNSGMTAAAVTGLRMQLHGPVPLRGAEIDVATETGGTRVLVTAAGHIAATGTFTLVRP